MPRDPQHARLPGHTALERLLERVELALTADEPARPPSPAEPLAARQGRSDRLQLVDWYRVREALNGTQPKQRCGNERLGAAPGFFEDTDRVRLCDLFHSGTHMGCPADLRV